MKSIVNKKTETVALQFQDGVKTGCTTADIMKWVVLQQPPNGFTVEEMESRLRIKEVLDNATDEIDLEDADAKKLKTLVEDSRWPAVNEELFQILQDVRRL